MTSPAAMTNSPAIEAPAEAPILIDELTKDGAVQPPNNLYSEEPPLETTLHLQQMMLLLNCLHWIWKDREDYFAAGNLTVYYSPHKRKNEDFRGPDFFVVLNTQPHPRKSWMVWEEDGKYPNVIVELLSDSTATVDRDLKKRLYAETFRTPEYFWFDPDPDSQEFKGFALLRGQYQPIEATAEGWLWSEQLQLHLGIHNQQLRFFDANKALVPTPDEAAILAQETAAAAKQALTSEQQQSAKLADKLRELGVDPDTL